MTTSRSCDSPVHSIVLVYGFIGPNLSFFIHKCQAVLVNVLICSLSSFCEAFSLLSKALLVILIIAAVSLAAAILATLVASDEMIACHTNSSLVHCVRLLPSCTVSAMYRGR